MPGAHRQFRILYRGFLSRIIDAELLSSGAELQKLLVQFAAMLAAFSLCYVVVRVTGLARANVPASVLSRAVLGDQEFLIATTMAIAGLFTILAWNTILPDRRDCLILGLLPIRLRTVFFAKTAAIATGLGISIAALNSFTGLTVPFLTPPHGPIRSFLAYWTACSAAGLFVCAALIALQGLAAQLLGYRLFLRLSSWLQLASFFTILGAYFLKPAYRTSAGLDWLPSFWFTGLLQQLQGVRDPLAMRALLALTLALTVSGATFGLAYRGSVRRVVEQPDIVPAGRSGPLARLGTLLVSLLLPKSIDRAVVLFIARTAARSRNHRLLLAAFGGIGLAISLAYARDLIYGTTDIDPLFRGARWNTVNAPFLVASLVMLFFAVIGLRAVFALPVAPSSNWILRITAVHSPAAYSGSVRKAVYLLAVMPIWLIAVAALSAVWPAQAALSHAAVLAALSVNLVERALACFRKFPFACSYLPGKANLQVRLGCWGVAFLFIASTGVHIEYWAMQRPARFAVFLTVLGLFAVRAWRARAELASMPHNRVLFDDIAPPEVEALDLHRDSASYGAEVYIDAVTET
jgi:hypothetical protein